MNETDLHGCGAMNEDFLKVDESFPELKLEPNDFACRNNLFGIHNENHQVKNDQKFTIEFRKEESFGGIKLKPNDYESLHDTPMVLIDHYGVTHDPQIIIKKTMNEF